MNLLSISSSPPLPAGTGPGAAAQTPGLGAASPGTPAMSPNSLATGSSQPTSPMNLNPNPFGFGQPTVRGTALLTPEQQQQQQQQQTAATRYDSMPPEMGVYPRSYGMATNSAAMHRQAARQDALDLQQQQLQQQQIQQQQSPLMAGGILGNSNSSSSNIAFLDGQGQGLGQGSGQGGEEGTDLACGALGNGMGGSGIETLEKQLTQPTGGSHGHGLGQGQGLGAGDGMI